MKSIKLLTFLLPILMFSQIGINTETPSASLDIVSNGSNILELNNSANTNLITVNSNGAISFNGTYGALGQVLSSNGTSGTPIWTNMPTWNIIDDLQVSEEQVSTTTAFTNITGLLQTYNAGEFYEIEGIIIYNTQVTTTGINLSFGTGTAIIYSNKIDIPISTTSATLKHYASPSTEATNTSTGRINNNYAYMRLIFSPSVTGQYSIRFASEIAGSAITIKRGTNIKIRKLL